MTSPFETPVLVVGGGPVGMTLALNLARYGVRSILIERNPTTTASPKMDLTNGRTMELFHRLGLSAALRAAGVPEENSFDIAWITSLSGHQLHRFHYPSAKEMREKSRANNDGSHTREPPMRVSQVVIEPVLKRAVDDNPLIDVRFSTAFEHLVEQDADGVRAEIRSANGKIEIVRCRFLAGCDGGGSRVRRQLDIELDGDLGVGQAYMVHFRSDDREFLQRWGATWHYQSAIGTMIAQNDHDIWTLQCLGLPGVDRDTLNPAEVLEAWAGRPFNYEILQANPWDAHFVVAQAFQVGRVALAGDAAHQFVPTGGYGMNSGIADAAALSWKLTAMIQGWGDLSLLAAYEAERKPTAWMHLAASARHVGVRIAIGQVFAEAGELDGADSGVAARRVATGSKIAALGNIENESWGVEHGYRYDDSPIIVHEADPPPVDPITYRPSTWPGARLPHVFLTDGDSVHDKLGLYFTLLVLREMDISAFESAAQACGVPLSVAKVTEPGLRIIYERDLLLVRPDQHVAWRGDSVPNDCVILLQKIVGRGS